MSSIRQPVSRAHGHSQKIARQFKRLKKLSADAGAFNGGIFLVKNRTTGEYCVEKKLNSKDIDKNVRAGDELQILKRIRHANVVRYIAGFMTYEPAAGSIFMEWAEVGTLKTVIDNYAKNNGQIPEEYVFNVFQQLSAAAYLHTGFDIHGNYDEVEYGKSHISKEWEAIVHQDLKPQNIFLTMSGSHFAYPSMYPRLVVGDFGLSWYAADIGTGFETGGTWGYDAPESLSSPAADVWAMGATIFALCRLKKEGYLIAAPEGVRERDWLKDPSSIPPRGPGSFYSVTLTEILALCQECNPHRRSTAWEVAKCCKIFIEVNGEEKAKALMANGDGKADKIITAKASALKNEGLSSPAIEFVQLSEYNSELARRLQIITLRTCNLESPHVNPRTISYSAEQS